MLGGSASGSDNGGATYVAGGKGGGGAGALCESPGVIIAGCVAFWVGRDGGSYGRG